MSEFGLDDDDLLKPVAGGRKEMLEEHQKAATNDLREAEANLLDEKNKLKRIKFAFLKRLLGQSSVTSIDDEIKYQNNRVLGSKAELSQIQAELRKLDN